MTANESDPFSLGTEAPSEVGSSDLPADLAPIAEQLRRDSQELAQTYPAAGLELPVQVTTHGRSRPWMMIAAAAAASLAITVTAVGVSMRLKGREDRRVATAIPPTTKEHLKGGARSIDSPVAPAEVVTVDERIEFVLQASSPELEAILDAMGDEPDTVQRVSF